jgi:hypothetical protein
MKDRIDVKEMIAVRHCRAHGEEKGARVQRHFPDSVVKKPLLFPPLVAPWLGDPT